MKTSALGEFTQLISKHKEDLLSDSKPFMFFAVDDETNMVISSLIGGIPAVASGLSSIIKHNEDFRLAVDLAIGYNNPKKDASMESMIQTIHNELHANTQMLMKETKPVVFISGDGVNMTMMMTGDPKEIAKVLFSALKSDPEVKQHVINLLTEQ